MAIVTSQISSRFYEEYKDTEITFTKEIIHVLSMDPRQIYIKCAGSQWPCIINSTSFNLARIIIGTTGGAFQQLAKKDPPPVNLRFSFYSQDGQPINFFVGGKVNSIQAYRGGKDLAVVTISYTQRPPEDLILKIGHLLDANVNFVRRKNERIVATPENLRKLGIEKKEISASIDNITRNCIIQSLSFGSCQIILMGLAQFLKGKPVTIKFEFEDPHDVITMTGSISEVSPIKNRKDIVSATVTYNPDLIPLPYKLHINSFLMVLRKQDSKVRFEGEPPVASVKDALKEAAPSAEQNPAKEDATVFQNDETAAVSENAETSQNADPTENTKAAQNTADSAEQNEPEKTDSN